MLTSSRTLGLKSMASSCDVDSVRHESVVLDLFCPFLQSFSEHYKIPAINGGEMPAIEVFSLALKYLVAKLMKFISDTTGSGGIHPSSIQWVLTVPAIWKPGARQFMRKAAYKVIKHI